MSTDTREGRLARRIADLFATDPQFAAAVPDETVAAAVEEHAAHLPDIMRTVLDGYADRPALGRRAVRFVEDATGRTVAELLPHFETITYAELAHRIHGVTAALTDVHPGDRVALLGFTSVDYTTVDMALSMLGAVLVPLQTSAPLSTLRPIIAETEPVLIASSVDTLDDAVDAGPGRARRGAPGGVRPPCRGRRPPRRAHLRDSAAARRRITAGNRDPRRGHRPRVDNACA